MDREVFQPIRTVDGNISGTMYCTCCVPTVLLQYDVNNGQRIIIHQILIAIAIKKKKLTIDENAIQTCAKMNMLYNFLTYSTCRAELEVAEFPIYMHHCT